MSITTPMIPSVAITCLMARLLLAVPGGSSSGHGTTKGLPRPFLREKLSPWACIACGAAYRADPGIGISLALRVSNNRERQHDMPGAVWVSSVFSL